MRTWRLALLRREGVVIDLDLVEQIYDVPLGASTWDDVMRRLMADFSADVGVLCCADGQTEERQPLSVMGGDERMWHDYAEYYCTIDPWNDADKAGQFPRSQIAAGERHLPYKEYLDTEYYQDWWRPYDMYYTAGGRFVGRDGQSIKLSLPRSRRAGPYAEEQTAALTCYARHIVRAVALQRLAHERSADLSFELIAETYGLSPAETRLLEELSNTGSLKEASEQINRSYHTVRSQLRALFLKTGTSSQVQLMRLVHARSPQDPPPTTSES